MRSGDGGSSAGAIAKLLAFGLIVFAAVAHSAVTTRTSAFDYDGPTGLMTREVIEPDSTDYCLVKEHQYNGQGDRKSATTRNCNGTSGSVAGSNGNSEAIGPATSASSYFAPRSSSLDYGYGDRFPTLARNAMGHEESKKYDDRFGAVTSLKGPNQLTTSWVFDDLGRQVLETRADGNGTRTAYQFCLGVTVNGQAGTEPCPAIAGAAAAYVVTVTPLNSSGAANGSYTRSYYDALGRVVRKETQGWDGSSTKAVYVDTEFNSLGQVSRTSQPYYSDAVPSSIKWTAYRYDTLSRVVEAAFPDGSKSTQGYQGLTTWTTNDLGQKTTETRSFSGLLTSITDANGKVLAKTFDAYGSVLTVVDSAGNLIESNYDIRGRRYRQKDPDMGVWTYTYNALSEIVSQADANGRTTQIGYDVLGRVQSKTSDVARIWSYDSCSSGVGKLCQVSGSNGVSRTYSYDTLGRTSSITSTVNGNSYVSTTSYNSDGRVDAIGYPSGSLSIRHQYVGVGFLQRIADASDSSKIFWTATAVDAAGRALNHTLGNGVSTVNSFDPNTGRLTQTVASRASTTVQSVVYGYDTIGNLKSRVDSLTGVSAAYTYDSLNRLKTEVRQGGGLPSAQTIGFDYDDLGNIKSRSDLGVYSYPASGNGSVRPHAVSSIAGTVNGLSNPTYQYDAVGNLQVVSVSGAVVRSVSWGASNQADTITQTIGGNSNTLAFLYDSEGDRVRELLSRNGVVQRTTVYVNPGAGAGLFYEEESQGGAVKKKHYLSVAGTTIGVLTLTNGSAWTTQYWHKDHLGSTMVVTDGGGNVVERLAYEPFGKRRNADGSSDAAGTLVSQYSRRGFTGHEHDEDVGLINMNGRVFDPAIGRFLSADPVVQAPGVMQSYNRYTYGWNNPLGGVDPSGYSFWTSFRNAFVRAVAYVADGYGCGGYCSAAVGAYQGYQSGGGVGGVVGGLSGYYGYQLSASYPMSSGGVTDWGNVAVNASFNAAAGCASSSAAGGSCRNGAFSGAINTYGGAYGGALGQIGSGCISGAVSGGGCGAGARDAFASSLGGSVGSAAGDYVFMDDAVRQARYHSYSYGSGTQVACIDGCVVEVAVGSFALRALLASGAAIVIGNGIKSWAYGIYDAIVRSDGAGSPTPPAPGEIPTVDWSDPSRPPKGSDGKEWEWRGKSPQGGAKGGYVNPANPDQSVHPDLDHGAPVGPHWDFTDRGRAPSGWRVFPDGTVKPK